VRVGIVLQARMGSRRLPGKTLKKIGSMTVLELLLSRLSSCERVDELIVATTNEPEDDPIRRLGISSGFQVFSGSPSDVLDRYFQAAKSHKLEVIVRVTADCPVLDFRVVDDLVDEFQRNNLDFLSNSEPLPSTWPDGMDVSIFSFEALKKAWREAFLPSHREHVTFYFWQTAFFRVKRIELPQDLSDLRFTVDYPEDLTFFEELNRVTEQRGQDITLMSMEELVRTVQENSSLLRINQKFERGLGWEASFDADKEHGSLSRMGDLQE
jgi:spore coat polysaccharide biosynthesis protein SpsF (cytidylyltransferase family)